jgi:uncharacterized protein (UPF0332 family)
LKRSKEDLVVYRIQRAFIKTEIFEKSIGKLYSELFDKRQEGDYQDFFLLERDDTEPLIDPTEIFLQVIESHIKTV